MNNKRFALVFSAFLFGFGAQAHTHQPSDLVAQGYETAADMMRMRLIDRGDGSNPQWMTFGDAMELGVAAHQEGRCAGFMDITDQPEEVKTWTQAQVWEHMPMVEYFKLNLGDRPMKQGYYLRTAMGQLSTQELHRTITEMSAFRNRYYKSETGVKAAEYVASRFKMVSKHRSDVRVDLFKHSRWAQPSVVATVAGEGPKASEIVVIGGHLDSINQAGFGSKNMNAPGADDNASGTATVIEVFRQLMESGFKPNRTLMFMGYAAEEVGLWGSQEIANTFRQNAKSVVAVMQLDMTAFPGSGSQITFMTDFTNPQLTTFTQKLADTYVKIKWSTDKCGYACSDHASWHKAGFAAVMPFEALFSQNNRAIHTSSDVLDKLDMNHSLAFAKLGLAFMVELAKD